MFVIVELFPNSHPFRVDVIYILNVGFSKVLSGLRDVFEWLCVSGVPCVGECVEEVLGCEFRAPLGVLLGFFG